MENQNIHLSIVIPVYNRPAEVDELLYSLTEQVLKDFEVVIVEDGSSIICEGIVDKYRSSLRIHYFYKNNSGPGQSRNFGCEKATGNYFIFLDSDCVIPPRYTEIVYTALIKDTIDAFGGPDKAHDQFTTFQKAINYSMTSFLTTGGIRGGSEKLDKFYPRSFNMGYSKKVFEETKGFSNMRFGEDIDMSIRILKKGFHTKLIKDAAVYHKRRTSIKQFFKQVYNSGIARINLYKRYPESLKLVHALPSLFTLGTACSVLLSLFVCSCFIVPLLVFTVLLFADATLRTRSIAIGLCATLASYIQLIGYGSGFIVAFWKRIVLGRDEFAAFKNTFYK
ncbi:MAG TPA: glycosyltransferase [Cytophagaceae bacterium]|jgi:glycosyltransferase involved in cell wall biosynthesis|nr:glycosyltransferase [Cytophagaceae bacterium]